jgi:2-keto-3-deoxy-galactonokinase
MLEGRLNTSEVSSYISGLLLGHELNEATHYLTKDDTVVVIGSDHLCQRYLLALKENNINAVSLGSDIATCNGTAALLNLER